MNSFRFLLIFTVPALTGCAFRDNVLYLKHNLNAQAIGALRGDFSSLKAGISHLLEKMSG